MRYPLWHRRSGNPDAKPSAIDRAKKLLGALANRRELGGAPSLLERAVLDDGTVVTARFDGDLPQVSIRNPARPDAEESICEIYVESGMLDLGPNIAPDAGQRFNRGRPIFDDTPAVLHFGTETQCPQIGQSYNGRIKVAKSGKIGSQCIARKPSRRSRLRDPMKKQAQAVLPASSFTGLLHRYVSSIYGSDHIAYGLSGSANTLVVSRDGVAVELSPWSGTTSGLIEIDRALWFVQIGTSEVKFHKPVFGECANLVYKLWQGMPRSNDNQRKRADKIMTIALSDCMPALQPTASCSFAQVIGESLGNYGWAFDERQPRAALVTKTGGPEDRSRLLEMQFSVGSNGDVSVVVSTIAIGDCPVSQLAPLIVTPSMTIDAGDTVVANDGNSFSPTNASNTLDSPISAWYESGELTVVWYGYVVQDVLPIMRQSECFRWLPSESPVVPEVMSTCRDGNRCGGIFGMSEGNVAAGFYCKRGGVIVWSAIDIRETPVRRLQPSNYPDVYTPANKIDTEAAAISKTHLDYRTASHFENFDYVDLEGPSSSLPAVAHEGETCREFLLDPPHRIPCNTFYIPGSIPRQASPCPSKGAPSPILFTVEVARSAEWNIQYEAGIYPNVTVSGVHAWLPDHFLVIPMGARTAPIIVEYGLRGVRGKRYVGKSSYAKSLPGSTITASQTAECITRTIIGEAQQDTVTATHVVTFQIDAPHFLEHPARLQPRYAVGPGIIEYHGEENHVWVGTTRGALFPYSFDAVIIEPTSCIYGSEKFRSEVHVNMGSVTEFEENRSVAFSYDATQLDSIDFSGIGCSHMLDHAIQVPAVDQHIDVDAAGGSRILAERFMSDQHYLCDGYMYQAQKSLLGAAVMPVVNTAFGASIHMDRQTVTGGYSRVDTPSFVGWA